MILEAQLQVLKDKYNLNSSLINWILFPMVADSPDSFYFKVADE